MTKGDLEIIIISGTFGFSADFDEPLGLSGSTELAEVSGRRFSQVE